MFRTGCFGRIINPSTANAVPLPLGQGRQPLRHRTNIHAYNAVLSHVCHRAAERHAGRWSVVQISDLGNNTHAIAVKIFDFGNGEPLPTIICEFRANNPQLTNAADRTFRADTICPYIDRVMYCANIFQKICSQKRHISAKITAELRISFFISSNNGENRRFP